MSRQLVFAPARRRPGRWPAVVAAVAVVALVVAGTVIALRPDDDAASPAAAESPTSSSRARSTTAEMPATLAPPVLVGTPGNYQTIKTYVQSRNIDTSFQHRGDGRAPTVTLPNPGGLWEEGGIDTPNFAYDMLMYGRDAPRAGGYAPFTVLTVIKMVGNVDPQSLFLRASGDLSSRAAFVPDGPGRMGDLKGYPEFQFSGVADSSAGGRQVLVQKIVLCKWRQGFYLLQFDLVSAPEDRGIIDGMVADINANVVILGP